MQSRRARPTKDWLSAYLAGVALVDLAERSPSGLRPGSSPRRGRYLVVARAPRPEFPNALARMAELELRESVCRPSRRARRSSAPARWRRAGGDYALLHTQILARQAEFAAARAVLGPLLSPVYPKDVRESARNLMARIVEVESSRLAKSGGMGGTSTTAPVERPEARISYVHAANDRAGLPGATAW